jgi:hypothetical protein
VPEYEAYDFSWGTNKNTSPIQLDPRELADTQNVLPTTRGAIARRYGFAKYNATQAVASKKVTGLVRFYREASGASDIVIAACDTKILSVPTTGASTDLGATAAFTIDSGTDVYMQQFRDRMYGTAWGATNRKLFVVAEDPNTGTGLMAWDMGVTAPTTAAVAAQVTSGGTLTAGAYSYKFTYWYGESGAHGESNPAPVSNTITIAGGHTDHSITVTMFGEAGQIATAAAALDAGINGVYVYRWGPTEVDWVLVKVITLVDATALYWTDIDDTPADYDTLTTPPSDNYAPDKAKYLCVCQERMFAAHLHDGTDYYPKMVRWSLPGYPDIWPAANYLQAPSEHGKITGLATLGGTVYVFFESAIGKLQVYSGSSAGFEIVTELAGCKAPRSITVGDDGGTPCAFFLAFDHKVYRFDGYSARPVSDDIDPVLTGDANQSYMHTCAGGWDGEYYYLSYPYSTSTVPSREVRYNTRVRKVNEKMGYDTGTWWLQTYPSGKAPNVYCQLSGGTDAGELYWGNSGATGYVYKLDSGNTDDGAAISSYFQTGYWTMGAAALEKKLRRILFDMKSWVQVNVRWDTDWDTAAGSFVAPADTATPDYDDGLYYDAGLYYVGESPTRTGYEVPGQRGGVRLRMKVSASESNAPYTVYGLTVKWVPKREDRGH